MLARTLAANGWMDGSSRTRLGVYRSLWALSTTAHVESFCFASFFLVVLPLIVD